MSRYGRMMSCLSLRHCFEISLIESNQLKKILQSDSGILQDAFQEPTINFRVIGHNDGEVKLLVAKLDMRPTLVNFTETCPKERAHNLSPGEERRLAQIVSSTTVLFGLGLTSLGLGSRYRAMA